MTTDKITRSMELFQTNSKKIDSKGNSKDSFQAILDKQPTKNSSSMEETSKMDAVNKTDDKAKSYEDSKVVTSNDTVKDVSSSTTEDESIHLDRELSKDDKLSKEELIKKLEEIVTMMEQILMGQLNLTEEELNTVFNNLSLNTMDSLDMEQLKLIVLEAKGIDDVSVLLTDENLLESIQSLHNDLNEFSLLKDLNLTEEEIKSLMKQLENPSKQDFTGLDTALDENSLAVKEGIKIEVVKEHGMDTQHSDSNESSNTKMEASEEGSNYINPMNSNFEVNNVSTTSFTQGMEALNQMREIVDQVVEHIKLHIKPEQTSMELQLNPENLGRIQLSVVEKDGVLTASFKTLNPIAKEAIESQMHILRDNLNNQGLKVEAIEVTVSNFMFEQNGEAPTNQGSNHNSNKQFFFRSDDDISQGEKTDLINEVMEQSGSSVNYTA